MNYKVSEGKLLTFDTCTAASNIPAGTPVGYLSATRTIYTLGDDTTGLDNTALMGYHFIGITDKDYSAIECPVSVWTEGVFNLTLSRSGVTSGNMEPGLPVFADSGMTVNVGTGNTSDAAIGTLIDRPAEATGHGGINIKVRINPAVYRWTTWVGVAGPGGAYVTATQASPLCWPIAKGHA